MVVSIVGKRVAVRWNCQQMGITTELPEEPRRIGIVMESWKFGDETLQITWSDSAIAQMRSLSEREVKRLLKVTA